jgi:hypothetical protein
VSGHPPITLAADDVVTFPQGDRHVLSSAPDVEPFRLAAERVISTRNVTGQSAPLLPQAVQI